MPRTCIPLPHEIWIRDNGNEALDRDMGRTTSIWHPDPPSISVLFFDISTL